MGICSTHPGAKLLFQGGEFGQREEWNFEQSLDWHLLQYPEHAGIQALVRDLNAFYTGEKALHEKQFSAEGMRWIAYDDAENSVLAYLRSGEEESMVVVCNMLPNVLTNYRIGVLMPGPIKKFSTLTV